jgi:hypothetical protein
MIARQDLGYGRSALARAERMMLKNRNPGHALIFTPSARRIKGFATA